MAQILVRGLDDELVEKLKNRARRERRSLQAEVKLILEQAARLDMKSARELAEAIRKSFKGRRFEDSVRLIREDRNSR